MKPPMNFSNFPANIHRRESGYGAFPTFWKKNERTKKTGRACDQDDFDIALAEDKHDIAHLVKDWQILLAAHPGPQKIYQCPAFFRYLEETSDPLGEPFALLVARRRSDGLLVGIVPARLRQLPVQFRAGQFGCWTHTLPVVQILGSLPMIANRTGLWKAVASALLGRFPTARAISMQALPIEACESFGAVQGLLSHVLDGWRECHTIPLPESFEAYLHKFSAKKRYNLARQVRLLTKEAGPLQVTRIERPDQARVLLAAVRALVPARDLAAFPSRQSLERLAANGLLLSHVVTCGGEPVGVVVATNGIDKWMVHNIFSAKKYHHLSAGTSTLHLALEDVINGFAFEEADFGYGTPNRDFRSTHVLKMRGNLLLYRPEGLTPWLLACHAIHSRLCAGIATRIKRLRRRHGLQRD